MIYGTRRLIRWIGWLLTPFVAWAASFLGGWLGALIGNKADSPITALATVVTGAIIAAAAGAILWAWGLRRAWLSALKYQREKRSRERQLRLTAEDKQGGNLDLFSGG
ncbi:MAG: hypothetical protein OEZ54_02325 [Gemmatimonadota bacterium]|nr:hypothetical protein [Gemmatimonadota bacterium]